MKGLCLLANFGQRFCSVAAMQPKVEAHRLLVDEPKNISHQAHIINKLSTSMPQNTDLRLQVSFQTFCLFYCF